jgi:hypothetical protein
LNTNVASFQQRRLRWGMLATLAACAACSRPGARAPGATGSDAEIIARFQDLHTRIYRAYSVGPARDALHDLLASCFAGRQLTREYVEHYTTLRRMQAEKTSIQVLRVDYESVKVVERRGSQIRIDVDWSVGGLVAHQNHRHARINRYQAVYTLAEGADGMRIVEAHARNAERRGTLTSAGATRGGLDADAKPAEAP